MTDHQFKALLIWRMCSDPFPAPNQDEVDYVLNGLARERGFTDWVDAYHKLPTEPLFLG